MNLLRANAAVLSQGVKEQKWQNDLCNEVKDTNQLQYPGVLSMHPMALESDKTASDATPAPLSMGVTWCPVVWVAQFLTTSGPAAASHTST